MATIRIERHANSADALAQHKQITGSDFFECYESSKCSILRLAETLRVGEYMVDIQTGDIYYIARCPDGLLILNKLTLYSCMDDSPFHKVIISENEIVIFEKIEFARDKVTRQILSETETIVN